MIKYSIIIFLLLFIGFNTFIYLKKKEFNSVQYQHQENVISIQHFLYNKNPLKGIIIGTSLSAKLSVDSMDGVYSLSMAGLSVLDGLHILFLKNDIPPVVFIETNYFFKPESTDFTSQFDSKASNYIKAVLPALQDENQPAGIVKHYLRKPEQKTAAPLNDQALSDDVFVKLLKMQQETYRHPDTALIRKSLHSLQVYVQEIQKRGNRVCFFEMPVHPSLDTLVLSEMVRKDITDKFPDNPYIKNPSGIVYNTTDGIHLDKVSIWLYSRYFRQVADSIF